MLGVIGIGAAAITYYGRHTYFVGFDADAVVIYQGRPGGVLWIEPEVVERTGHHPQRRAGRLSSPRSSDGKVEPTLDDAHRYLANLDEQIGVDRLDHHAHDPAPVDRRPTTTDHHAGN